MRPVLSIVLPVLNEEESLAAVVERIQGAMADALGRAEYELVFVDDGSQDHSWRVIASFLRTHPHWQGVRLTRRFGHQAALLAGLSAARGAAVVTMDSDGQHPPSLLPRMIEAWRGGAKVVQAVRRETQATSRFKRWTSRLYYGIFSRLCEVPARTAAADFRLLDRSVVDLILDGGRHVPFLRGLIPWLGCRTEEIEFTPSSRIGGRPSYTLSRMIRLAVDGLMSFSIVPLRLGIWCGLAVASLSIAYLCYVGFIYLFGQGVVPGWASTAGLVALLGGVQLFCVGLLGEYLGRLYVMQLGRPRFVVDEWAMGRVGEQVEAREPQSTDLASHEQPKECATAL